MNGERRGRCVAHHFNAVCGDGGGVSWSVTAAQECRSRVPGSISSGLTPTLREDWTHKRALETPCHARIASSPQDPTAMSPDHWSKLTWDTVSAGGYDLFDPIGYLDRKHDRAYKQRVIVTPAIQKQLNPFPKKNQSRPPPPQKKKKFKTLPEDSQPPKIC